jgi:hypothetical protein
MSYCRFSKNSDVYLYPSVNGGIVCCSCSLSPLTNTIWTKGGDTFLGKNIPPCKDCGGVGCPSCQMHSDTTIHSLDDAIKHLREHKKAGHKVPSYAINRLKEEIKIALSV